MSEESIVEDSSAPGRPLTIRDLTMGLIGEWWMMAMMGLYDEHGPGDCLDLLRPYYLKNGIWGWMRIDELMGIKDDTKLRLAAVTNVAASMNPAPYKVSIMEKGIYIELFDCPFAHMPFNVCDGHLVKDQGLGPALNTTYAVKHLKRQSWGNDRCVHVLRDQSTPEGEWGDCGKELAVMLPPLVPRAVLDDIALQLVADLWVGTVDAYVEGSDERKVIDRLRPQMNRSGRGAGMRFYPMLGPDPRRDDGVSSILVFFGEVMKQKLETVGRGNEIDSIVDFCPFKSSSPAVCALFDSFVEGLCQSVDPAFRLNATKLDCGHSCVCHWRIRK